MRFTKIICTIGPASRDENTLRQLIAAGTDVARINFSHGDHAIHAQTIHLIRTLAREMARPIAILGDLQGPKLRIGALPPEGRLLSTGDEILFSCDAADETAIPCQYADLPRLVRPGDHILLDDGLL